MLIPKVIPKFRIEKSKDGEFIFLRIGDHVEVLTMSDWSKVLTQIKIFEPHIIVPPKVTA